MRTPPPRAIHCSRFTFYWTICLLPSGDPLINFLITASYRLAVRDAGFSRDTGFFL